MILMWKFLIRSFYAIEDDECPKPFEPETIWVRALDRFMELATAVEFSVKRYHAQYKAVKGEPPPCPKAPDRNIAPFGSYEEKGILVLSDKLKDELITVGLHKYTSNRKSVNEYILDRVTTATPDQ